MTERLLIIGGDAGGMTAATAARRARPDDFDIVAFESGVYTSYIACGLPYYLAGEVMSADDLVARGPDEHRDRGIDVRTRHEVIGIDTNARTIQVRDLDAATEHLESYDYLVIATGARPIRPKVPGIDTDGVHVVKTLPGAIALRKWIDQHQPRHAVVVGGGYIGVEMAESLIRRGINVTMVDRASQPMLTLDPDMGGLVADALRARGVELVLDAELEGITERSGTLHSVVTKDHEFVTDLVILGLGVKPDIALAEAAGVEIGPTHGIATDDHQRTSAPDVFAAGDCVQTYHRLTGRPVTVALGTHANKQGTIAGVNASGGDARFAGVLGSAITKFFETEIARTGLSSHEAEESDFAFDTIVAESTTQSGYMPGAPKAHVKMMIEQGTGRILGGQIVGGPGSGKRIDTLAAAIWNGMTTSDLVDLDLAYVPPLSPLFDPVQIPALKDSRRRHT